MSDKHFGELPDDIDVVPSENTIAFFEKLTLTDLTRVLVAYRGDQQQAKLEKRGQEFCKGRIALIERIIRERQQQ